MKILDISLFLRGLQFIPLIAVFIPLLRSCWDKRNKINGLRPTRLVLLFLFTGLIASNTYFVIFSLFNFSRALPLNQVAVVFEKIVSLVSYSMLYFLFKHAADHNDGKKKK